MKLINKTSYTSRSIRSRLAAAFKEFDAKPTAATVTFQHGAAGLAVQGMFRLIVNLPSDLEPQRAGDYLSWGCARVASHMAGRIIGNSAFRFACKQLGSEPPEQRHKPGPKKKLPPTERMMMDRDKAKLAAWTSKLRRAETAIKKYERRIKLRQRRIDSGEADAHETMRALRDDT